MSTRTFRDTYEILAKIGEGGMGAIYKVRHRHLDQERVIKIMRPQVTGDDDFEARFLREARLEAQLQHQNIAQLYEFEIAPEGSAYIVMEFIEGVTLRQVLDIAGPPTVELCLFIAKQGLEALAYLHRCGFVHRDISPDNIMLGVDTEGRPMVKVIDLGIAKKTEESRDRQITRTGTFIGKVQYASPEQFSTKPIDSRSDLYSFGIVLYEILTGAYPIEGNDTNSLIGGHLFKPPMPFAKSDPRREVPEAVRGVVLKSLSKAREDRYATGSEFGEALSPIAEGLGDPVPEALRLIKLCQAEPDPVRSGDDLDIFGTEETRLRSARMPMDTAKTEVMSGAATVDTVILTERGRSKRTLQLLAGLTMILLLVVLYQWQVAERILSSEGIEVSFELLPRPLPADLSFGEYHALVIGNDNYRSLPPLRTAVSDAKAVGDLLETSYGFNVTRLYDATRIQIFEALERLAATLDADDNLLLYYAGHGELYTDDSLYWQPIDADPDSTVNWLATDDLNIELKDSRARSVLVVADSCYAGALAGTEYSGPNFSQDRLAYVKDRVRRSARLALTSGGFSPVADAGTGADHSVFARVFLDQLAANDRVLDGARLFQEVVGVVERRAAGLDLFQRPVYAPLDSAGDEGGEFFFVPTLLRETKS